MKRKTFLNNLIALFFAAALLLSLCSLTAFAEDGGYSYDNGVPYYEDTPQTPISGDSVPEDAQTNPVPIEQEPIYDYIYGEDEEATSGYEEPEHLSELPEVAQGEVVEATAVPTPAVAASDASIFSGIVMWLCVALGIAVLVGVLVSKRTLRRGM